MFKSDVPQSEVSAYQSSAGIQRYRKKSGVTTAKVNRGGLMRLMSRVLAPETDSKELSLEEAIATHLEIRVQTKTLNKSARPFKFQELLLDSVAPDVLAYCTAKTILSQLSITYEVPVTSLAFKIANAIQEEIKLGQLKSKDEIEYNRLLNKVDKQIINRHKLRRINTVLKEKGIPNVWDASAKVSVGVALIDLFVEYTGLASRSMKIMPGLKTKAVLTFNPDVIRWLRAADTRLEVLFPIRWPMVETPRPWTNMENGGYPKELKGRRKLVMGFLPDYMEPVWNKPMKPVYEAINNIQNTGWRINTKVLAVMETLWRQTDNHSLFADTRILPVPPKLSKEDYEALSPASQRELREKIDVVIASNASASTRTYAMVALLRAAHMFRQVPHLYFPHELCFRGRIYPATQDLTPQGFDAAKGVLEFDTGKALGEEGAGWLAVHGAGCYGKDNLTLDDRVLWVEYNTRDIIASATDPYQHSFWLKANKPWQFLAFCYEWKSYLEDGDSYISHLPVGQDGTCNGLQHLAAMIRDEEGGYVVNLIPSDSKKDAYSTIKDEARRINRTQTEGEDYPQRAARFIAENDIIDRDMVKRPTMTMVYGVTAYGMEEQIREKLTKKAASGAISPPEWDLDLRIIKIQLTKVVREALASKVSGAYRLMEFLNQCAKIANEAEIPVEWEIPQTGFKVSQFYPKFKRKQIRTALPTGGEFRAWLRTPGEDKKLDTRKCVSSITPNWTHSFDAAHLMLSVNLAAKHGVTHFHMVHDQYGTHAADVGVMSACLRQTFVELYSKDHLQQLRDNLESRLPVYLADKLPPVPEKGILNLEDVLKSDYFFS